MMKRLIALCAAALVMSACTVVAPSPNQDASEATPDQPSMQQPAEAAEMQPAVEAQQGDVIVPDTPAADVETADGGMVDPGEYLDAILAVTQEERASFASENNKTQLLVHTHAAVIDDEDGYTNVRADPSSSGEIIARIQEDELFLTSPQDSDWWSVRLGTQERGYVHRSRIRLLTNGNDIATHYLLVNVGVVSNNTQLHAEASAAQMDADESVAVQERSLAADAPSSTVARMTPNEKADCEVFIRAQLEVHSRFAQWIGVEEAARRVMDEIVAQRGEQCLQHGAKMGMYR